MTGNEFGVSYGKVGLYIQRPPLPMQRLTRYEAGALAARLLVFACEGDILRPIPKERADIERNPNGPDAPTLADILADLEET